MKRLGLVFFVALFTFTGLVHLISPATFEKVIPPVFPFPHAIAIISGLVELGFAAGFVFSRTRAITAWAVMAFFVAVLPVHVYMWVERDTLFTEFPAWALLLRFPVQGVLIWLSYLYTGSPSKGSTGSTGSGNSSS